VELVADGLAVMWVVVVAAQYALVMWLPGAPDLSASYLPLLAGVVIAGIMRYWRKEGCSREH
jgi:hypothetical protein